MFYWGGGGPIIVTNAYTSELDVPNYYTTEDGNAYYITET